MRRFSIDKARRLDDRSEVVSLLMNIKADLGPLRELLASASNQWGYEDPVYRFYHQSFKVYDLQSTTLKIVHRLRRLSPRRPLDKSFMSIIKEGTARRFSAKDNARWVEATRPILEAFLHARFFLEMAVRYGRTLRRPPGILPSGWAALLCLYGLR